MRNGNSHKGNRSTKSGRRSCQERGPEQDQVLVKTHIHAQALRKIFTHTDRVQVADRDTNQHAPYGDRYRKDPNAVKGQPAKTTHAPRHKYLERFRIAPDNQQVHQGVNKITDQKSHDQKHSRVPEAVRHQHHQECHRKSTRRRRSKHPEMSEAKSGQQRKGNPQTCAATDAEHKRPRKRVPE